MTEDNEPAEIWNFWGQEIKAPPPDVLKFQAELMDKGFRWAEKRQIPGLTIGFAQQRAALKLAGDTSIQARLDICGQLDQNQNKHECGVVFCPRCLMLRRGKQTATNLRIFAHLGNEKLAFMTVLVKVITDLNEARSLQDKFLREVRDHIMAKRKRDSAWDDVCVKGYWEFDHLLDTDELGHNAKIALPPLGFPEVATGQSCWLLHFHAIVGLGDVARDEFKAVMQGKKAPHPYQVDVQAFDTDKDVKQNIRRITRYSMKFRIEDDYKRIGPFDPDYVFDRQARSERKWWPKVAVGSLASYLSQPLHGYRSLEFWIGPKGKTKNKTGVRTKGRQKFTVGSSQLAPSPQIADMIANLKKSGATQVEGKIGKQSTQEHSVSLPKTWEFGED